MPSLHVARFTVRTGAESPTADIQRPVPMHDPSTAFAAPEKASYVEDATTVAPLSKSSEQGETAGEPASQSRMKAPWYPPLSRFQFLSDIAGAQKLSKIHPRQPICDRTSRYCRNGSPQPDVVPAVTWLAAVDRILDG